MAIRSHGYINKTYGYDHLKIKKINNKTCLISGEIVNKTGKLKDGVWIKVYAFNIHREFLWSEILFFSTIPARGKISFSETINECFSASPYKLKFKVTD